MSMEDDNHSGDEGEVVEEEACIPMASMREAIAPYLLLQQQQQQGRLRITRSALLRLRHAAEAHLVDVFGVSGALCELQKHRTLRVPAFRLAARLSSSSSKGGASSSSSS